MFMRNYSFKQYLENAPQEIKIHFQRTINPFEYKCEWREKVLSKIINKNTVRKNRYFHLVANYVDCVAQDENREFINSLGSPDGDGWRAIKRHLKMFEKRAYERLFAFKHTASSTMRETWKEYGRVLEGKELADISFRYNLCTRWENPRVLYSDNCVLLETECGHLIQMNWSELLCPVIYEVQNRDNNWPMGYQILWLIKERKKNPKKWEGISWHMDCFEKEHYYKEKIGNWYLRKLKIDGEAYDLDIDSGKIVVYYKNLDGFYESDSQKWVDTPEQIELLKKLQNLD